MSKVKATRRPTRDARVRKRSAAKTAYFVIRGRRVRIDEVDLVIPQADGSCFNLVVDKTKIRYAAINAAGETATTTYEHDTLTASLGC